MDIRFNAAQPAVQGTSQAHATQAASQNFAGALAESQEALLRQNYSLASWQADYRSDSLDLSVSSGAIAEGRVYMQLSEAARADSVITRAEQAAIDSYRDTMSNTQQLKQHQAFNSRYQQQLSEYSQLFNEALAQAQQAEGFAANALVNDFNASAEQLQRIETGVRAQLLANPRAQQLMGMLKIDFSA